MTITDTAVLIFLLLQAVIGINQGFLRAIIGPTALFLAIGLGAIHYKLTRNFGVSCIISVIGQLILPWLLGRLFKFGLNQFDSPQISLLSRLGGMTVNLIWGIVITALAVTLLALVPFNKLELRNADKDVHASISLSLLKPTLVKKGLLAAESPSTDCVGDLCKIDEADIKDLASDADIQALLKDPRMIKLMNDPQAVAAFQSRDIKRIFENPVLNELRQDPEFLLKALKIYPKIQKHINAH